MISAKLFGRSRTTQPEVDMSNLLHATKLSNGRLQLWVTTPFFQIILPESPGADWKYVQPFPDVSSPIKSVAAGHSPDGDVQLWVATSHRVLTIRQTGANHTWGSWEHFESAGEIAGICAVAQLKDGRMQAFANSSFSYPCKISTAWKVSTQPGASWSDWQNIAPPPDSEGDGFMSVVVVGPLSDGRLQMWAKARKNPQSATHLYTSWQTSTDPTVPWTAWQKFSTPPHHPRDETGLIGESVVVDGRTHLWLLSPASTLQSIKKTSSDPDSDWSDWTDPFHSLEGPQQVTDVAAATRHDGTCQLWVLVHSALASPARVITTRQIGSHPLVWSAWTLEGSAFFGPL
jgi:hypothetical protein